MDKKRRNKHMRAFFSDLAPVRERKPFFVPPYTHTVEEVMKVSRSRKGVGETDVFPKRPKTRPGLLLDGHGEAAADDAAPEEPVAVVALLVGGVGGQLVALGHVALDAHVALDGAVVAAVDGGLAQVLDRHRRRVVVDPPARVAVARALGRGEGGKEEEEEGGGDGGGLELHCGGDGGGGVVGEAALGF